MSIEPLGVTELLAASRRVRDPRADERRLRVAAWAADARSRRRQAMRDRGRASLARLLHRVASAVEP